MLWPSLDCAAWFPCHAKGLLTCLGNSWQKTVWKSCIGYYSFLAGSEGFGCWHFISNPLIFRHLPSSCLSKPQCQRKKAVLKITQLKVRFGLGRMVPFTQFLTADLHFYHSLCSSSHCGCCCPVNLPGVTGSLEKVQCWLGAEWRFQPRGQDDVHAAGGRRLPVAIHCLLSSLLSVCPQ